MVAESKSDDRCRDCDFRGKFKVMSLGSKDVYDSPVLVCGKHLVAALEESEHGSNIVRIVK